MKLIKSDPKPRSNSRTREWEKVAAVLRAAPGVWHASPIQFAASTTINQGLLKAFAPAGAFEAQRSEGVLHIRYKGAPSDAPLS